MREVCTTGYHKDNILIFLEREMCNKKLFYLQFYRCDSKVHSMAFGRVLLQ